MIYIQKSALGALIVMTAAIYQNEAWSQTKTTQGSSAAEAAVPAAATPAPRALKLRFLQRGVGTPIRKVEVKIGQQIYFSDPDGRVEVELASATKEIFVRRVGFEPVTLDQGDFSSSASLEVYLLPALGSDDEVVVRGKRRPGVSKKVVSVEEARRVAPGGDPGQIAKLLPGVQTSLGQSQVAIRGSKPDDSKYYIDDLEVPFVYHMIGQNTVVPKSLIDDVEFSAGGFGVEYGDSLGGVIAIRTKTFVPERPRTELTLNLPIYSGVYHERPLSETSALFVAARRSYLDLILKKVLPADSGLTVVPFYDDYQATYVSKSDEGHYKVTALASRDGLHAVTPGGFSSDEEGKGKIDFKTYYGILGVETSRRLSANWSVMTTPQVLYTNNSFEVNDLNFRLRAWQARVPTEFTRRMSSDEKLYVGFDPIMGDYKVSYFVPRFDPEDPFFDFEEAPREEGVLHETAGSFSAWVAEDFKFDQLLITPGVRAFYFQPTGKSSADPRLSARFALTKEQTIKGAVGQYSRFPRNGEPAKDFGNPDLDFPVTYHYVLGLETQWSDRVSTDIQGFYKTGRKIIRTDTEKKYDNDGSMRSYGAEFFIRRALTERWFGWLAYTYSKTQERASDETDWYNGQYDQTHVLNVAGSYKWSARWDTGGRIAHHTGDTYTSKLGDAVYNTQFDKYQPRSGDTNINGNRMPSYNEMAVFSSNDFLFDEWKMTLRYGIEYFWFERQAFGVETNYDYSKETYFKGVPPIPYIELTGEF